MCRLRFGFYLFIYLFIGEGVKKAARKLLVKKDESFLSWKVTIHCQWTKRWDPSSPELDGIACCSLYTLNPRPKGHNPVVWFAKPFTGKTLSTEFSCAGIDSFQCPVTKEAVRLIWRVFGRHSRFALRAKRTPLHSGSNYNPAFLGPFYKWVHIYVHKNIKIWSYI